MYSFIDIERFGPTDADVFYEVFLTQGINGYECIYANTIADSFNVQYTRVIFGNNNCKNTKILKEIYKKMKDDNVIELINNEQNDDYSDDSLFNISS